MLFSSALAILFAPPAEEDEGNRMATDVAAVRASTSITTGSSSSELGPTGGNVGKNGLSYVDKDQLTPTTAAQKVKEQLGDLSAK
jgi:hypothetical protein